MSRIAPHIIERELATASTVARVIQLTAYAEQESAFLNSVPLRLHYADVARKGRERLAALTPKETPA